ncbi:hypothetical protein J2Z66_008669 [Paenibacillus eucommiae]|uniref:Secreted protein n=1 Tax=Paenibacillus eucommiae TaxID=1355755 RepID=A0ABS4JCM7_9BACL|nr:hypothetical protein [Paenibacillus eucommiae]
MHPLLFAVFYFMNLLSISFLGDAWSEKFPNTQCSFTVGKWAVCLFILRGSQKGSSDYPIATIPLPQESNFYWQSVIRLIVVAAAHPR